MRTNALAAGAVWPPVRNRPCASSRTASIGTGNAAILLAVPVREVCPGQALTFYGKTMTAREVLDKVEEDAAFYARSGGGLTLSGGEPLQQGDFCLSILEEAEHRAVHTAMESCGQAPEETILAACGKLDYLLFDIKHLDSEAHKKATGMGNERILRNLAAVRSAYPHLPIHLRTPLVPGINDDEELIRRIVELARSMDAVHYELLPYHRMGEQKYRFFGQGISLWRPCSGGRRDTGAPAGYRRGSFSGKGLISVKECVSIAGISSSAVSIGGYFHF